MSNDPNDYPKMFTFSIKEGQKKNFTISDTPFLVISNACLNIPIETTSFIQKPTRLFAHCQTRTDDKQTQLSPICIATLIPQKNEHCLTQLKLLLNESVEFEVVGPYQVDVIGYFSSPEIDNDSDSDERMLKRIVSMYEEEEEEEEIINTSDFEKELKRQYSINGNDEEEKNDEVKVEQEQ